MSFPSLKSFISLDENASHILNEHDINLLKIRDPNTSFIQMCYHPKFKYPLANINFAHNLLKTKYLKSVSTYYDGTYSIDAHVVVGNTDLDVDIKMPEVSLPTLSFSSKLNHVRNLWNFTAFTSYNQQNFPLSLAVLRRINVNQNITVDVGGAFIYLSDLEAGTRIMFKNEKQRNHTIVLYGSLLKGFFLSQTSNLYPNLDIAMRFSRHAITKDSQLEAGMHYTYKNYKFGVTCDQNYDLAYSGQIDYNGSSLKTIFGKEIAISLKIDM